MTLTSVGPFSAFEAATALASLLTASSAPAVTKPTEVVAGIAASVQNGRYSASDSFASWALRALASALVVGAAPVRARRTIAA